MCRMVSLAWHFRWLNIKVHRYFSLQLYSWMSWNSGPPLIYVVPKLFERQGNAFQKAVDRHSNQNNCLSLDCNYQHAKGDHDPKTSSVLSGQ